MLPRTLLLQTSPVAGFQYHDGEAVWASLREGLALDLVREAVNVHDDKAVRIEWAGRKLGYLPRVENHAVAQLLDRGERLDARIAGVRESRDPWERVRIMRTGAGNRDGIRDNRSARTRGADLRIS